MKMEEQSTKEVKLENLPMHELKRQLKEKDIKFLRTDKKPQLVAMLKAGKTIHAPKPVEKKHNLSDTASPKVIPLIPNAAKPHLEQLAEKGLEWKINEDDCTITFSRDLTATCTLDTTPNNIVLAARSAFRKGRPIEKGRDGQRVEWV